MDIYLMEPDDYIQPKVTKNDMPQSWGDIIMPVADLEDAGLSGDQNEHPDISEWNATKHIAYLMLRLISSNENHPQGVLFNSSLALSAKCKMMYHVWELWHRETAFTRMKVRTNPFVLPEDAGIIDVNDPDSQSAEPKPADRIIFGTIRYRMTLLDGSTFEDALHSALNFNTFDDFREGLSDLYPYSRDPVEVASITWKNSAG